MMSRAMMAWSATRAGGLAAQPAAGTATVPSATRTSRISRRNTSAHRLGVAGASSAAVNATLPHCRAEHVRIREQPRRSEVDAARMLDAEAGRSDRADRIATAMAAAPDARPDAQAIELMLQARLALALRADVFKEPQLGAGPEHATQLSEHARLILHGAQHEARRRGIEAGVGE